MTTLAKLPIRLPRIPKKTNEYKVLCPFALATARQGKRDTQVYRQALTSHDEPVKLLPL
jgi:hypothetical protein